MIGVRGSRHQPVGSRLSALGSRLSALGDGIGVGVGRRSSEQVGSAESTQPARRSFNITLNLTEPVTHVRSEAKDRAEIESWWMEDMRAWTQISGRRAMPDLLARAQGRIGEACRQAREITLTNEMRGA
jgi:hypothetical protein